MRLVCECGRRPRMASAVATVADEAHEAPASSVLGLWVRHLLAFWFPVNACLFLATGPHRWWVALLFVLPIALAHRLDTSGRVERRQPPARLPAWPFDAIVYALAALQFVNVALLAR